jgi:hypothetical protein
VFSRSITVMQRLTAFTGIYVQIPVVAVVFPDFADFAANFL